MSTLCKWRLAANVREVGVQCRMPATGVSLNSVVFRGARGRPPLGSSSAIDWLDFTPLALVVAIRDDGTLASVTTLCCRQLILVDQRQATRPSAIMTRDQSGTRWWRGNGGATGVGVAGVARTDHRDLDVI